MVFDAEPAIGHVIARRGIADVPHEALTSEVGNLLNRARLLKEDV